MHDTMPSIIAILAKYTREPAHSIAPATTLAELDIDLLDLPMIALDIEDAFEVDIASDDDIDGFTTVNCLAAGVAARLEAKAKQPRRTTTVPRSKSNWMSTGAERRR